MPGGTEACGPLGPYIFARAFFTESYFWVYKYNDVTTKICKVELCHDKVKFAQNKSIRLTEKILISNFNSYP